MSDLYENLNWLVPAPGDFAPRCKALASDGSAGGAVLRELATRAMDLNQLARLARAIGEMKKASRSFHPLTPFRLGIVSNGTIDYLAVALAATAPRYGLILEVIPTPFDQAIQEATDPQSALHQSRPDAVLVALDYRALGLAVIPGEEARAAGAVDAAMAHLETIRAGLHREKILSVMQTVAAPPENLFGSLDAVVAGTIRQQCDALNDRIRRGFSAGESLVLDIAGLAGTVGLGRWHDPAQWALAKLPCALSLMPLYADHICRLIGALRGLSRRALVLDLDNTIWGGVIGDDGLKGIAIGQGDATGEAHLAVQRYALELRQRGVVLAVSSKNNDAIARQPFREHPDMLLKEEHFAAFQANWSDKAANIEAIAKALALGLDAFVFLDDNPAERELVRQKLPMVAVPELPADPALYVRTLAAAGYFEAATFSAEDRTRAAYYEHNARRLEMQKADGNLDDYLASLEMTATFAPFDPIGRARITQLINKSNQFNLTTRRYTELEIEALEENPAYITLQVRLRDRFGDNGMISVVICRREGSAWFIETWLMSCRVLKRRVEEAILQQLLKGAIRDGVLELRGQYIPTGRNAMVQDHYARLGFHPLESVTDPAAPVGSSHWYLRVAEVTPIVVPMKIECGGLSADRQPEPAPADPRA